MVHMLPMSGKMEKRAQQVAEKENEREIEIEIETAHLAGVAPAQAAAHLPSKVKM